MARMISCLRGLLLGFVVVLGFSGLIVSIGSGVFIYQLHEYSLLTPPSVDGPPLSLLGVGLLTIILAWFVWHFDYSSKSQIISLASLVVIVAIIEIGVGVWAIIRHQHLYELPNPVVQKAIVALNDLWDVNSVNSHSSEDVWHRMHTKLSCCGVHGANEDFRLNRKNVPWSCCREPSEDKNHCDRGCLHPMIHRTQSIFLFIFLLTLCSVILKGFIVAIAWCYAKAIKEAMEKRKNKMMMANKASAVAAAAAAVAAARPSFDERNANLSPLVEKARYSGI